MAPILARLRSEFLALRDENGAQFLDELPLAIHKGIAIRSFFNLAKQQICHRKKMPG